MLVKKGVRFCKQSTSFQHNTEVPQSPFNDTCYTKEEKDFSLKMQVFEQKT